MERWCRYDRVVSTAWYSSFADFVSGDCLLRADLNRLVSWSRNWRCFDPTLHSLTPQNWLISYSHASAQWLLFQTSLNCILWLRRASRSSQAIWIIRSISWQQLLVLWWLHLSLIFDRFNLRAILIRAAAVAAVLHLVPYFPISYATWMAGRRPGNSLLEGLVFMHGFWLVV